MRRLAALFGILLLMVAAPALGQSIMERLVTPGPLSSAHAKLESKCDSCHTSFKKEAQNSKCTACHKGIGSDISTKTRFHGKFAPARTKACKVCHSDHKGRGFALITLSRTNFNHGLTNYPLTGSHQKVECSGCHGRGNNYRGITTVCASCHKSDDPHKGQLGRKCQDCHTTSGWTAIKPFNHARTGFSLTGAHSQTKCASCHQNQRWKDLPSRCVDCHAKDDAHRGSRGTDCASCHATANWRSTSFNHASTGFPLVGGHAAASCTSCHGANNAIKNPSRTCFACHAKDDSHQGKNGRECASCHTPSSWKRVNFDHDRMTKFPLRGAHRRAECEGCHVKPAKEVKPATACFGCHAEDDSHEGGNGQDCQRCHNESAWKDVDFDHDTMTDFPLQGRHADAKCQACHIEPADDVKLTGVCGDCHAKDDTHNGNLGNNCGRCHDNLDWKANVRFDHDLTQFPLLGKHSGVECISCHIDKTFSVPAGKAGGGCAACHKDDHHLGALGDPAACGSCHNPLDWKAWKFDHNSRTDFALTGKHTGLICSACHTRAGDPGDLGSECVDCHKRNDVHRGGFGSDCASCHITDSFRQIIVPRK